MPKLRSATSTQGRNMAGGGGASGGGGVPPPPFRAANLPACTGEIPAGSHPPAKRTDILGFCSLNRAHRRAPHQPANPVI